MTVGVAMPSEYVPVDVLEDLPATHGRARTWTGQRLEKAHRSPPALLANLAELHGGVTRSYQAVGLEEV